MEQQLSMYTSTCICSIISVNIRISGFMTQVLLICVFTDTPLYPVVDSSASHTYRLYQYIYIYIYIFNLGSGDSSICWKVKPHLHKYHFRPCLLHISNTAYWKAYSIGVPWDQSASNSHSKLDLIHHTGKFLSQNS